MNPAQENITQNIHRFYTRIAELNAYEHGMVSGLEFVWNRKGSWPSYLLGVPGPEKIPEVVRAMESGQAPPFCIVDKSRQEEIQLMERSGIRTIREWKGMFLDSRYFNADVWVKDIPGLELRINDRASLDDWLILVNTELMSGVQIGQEVIDSLSACDEFQFAVAYVDGQPAATGLSFREQGICGLYMIVTRASLRGKGIGSLVTASLIHQAVNLGDKGIVLHATNLGERLYSNLGFKVLNHLSVLWYLGK